MADASDLLQRPLAGFFDGEVRTAAEAAIGVARQGGRGQFQDLMPTSTGVPKWWDAVLTPITDGGGRVVQLLAVSRDITERRREEAFRAAQHQVLEMIATGSPLPVVLDSVVRLVEHQTSGVQCTILLLDDDGVTIRSGSAPGMPAGYLEALSGLTIGPRAGSCGTAMYLGQPVIVTDVLTDPLWEDYLDVAVRFGFRACWSTPIFSPDRKVLGSLAMYSAQPRAPRQDEWRLIETAADIARIAIDQRSRLAGAPAQRGPQPGDPAGHSRLDVPDHARRRVPRLPCQGRRRAACVAGGLPRPADPRRAAAACRRRVDDGFGPHRRLRQGPRRSNTRSGPMTTSGSTRR